MSATPLPRHRLALDERRAQLLELGARLFSERSYDEVSIDDIADAAGVSKGLLYHYFGSKRAFYVATVRQAAEQLQDRTAPDLSLPQPARARAGLDSYLSFVEEHASPYASLMRSGIGNDPEVAAIVEDTRGAILGRMMGELGLEAPRPIVRLALRSWIGLVEAASLEWLDRRDVARETLLALMLESLASTLLVAARLDPEAGVLPATPATVAVGADEGAAGPADQPPPPPSKARSQRR
jgi:AcrR family transcriptional regulator